MSYSADSGVHYMHIHACICSTYVDVRCGTLHFVDWLYSVAIRSKRFDDKPKCKHLECARACVTIIHDSHLALLRSPSVQNVRLVFVPDNFRP